MLEYLQCLLSLSAALDKPKVERSARADTKKNRLGLAQACRTRSIETLRQILDLGSPVNFLIEERFSGSVDRSLLGICADNGWFAGARALIDSGADERLIPQFFEPIKNYHGSAPRPSFARTASDRGHSDIFALSIPLISTGELTAILAQCNHPAIFMAAHTAGHSDLVPQQVKVRLLLASLASIDPSSNPEGSAVLCFDALLSELASEPDLDLVNTLWVKALSLCSPGVIQGLAVRQMVPTACWTVHFLPETHLRADTAPGSLSSISTPSKNGPAIMSWKPEAKKSVALGLASAAAAFASISNRPHALRALCTIEPLRRELFTSEFGLHYLSQIFDVDTHKRLSQLGMDLTLVRSTEGQNPLHWAARQKQPKNIIESLARVCTSWIDQLDSAGKRPLDLVTDNDRKQDLSVFFDQIGMRAALGGRRGLNKVTTQRRL